MDSLSRAQRTAANIKASRLTIYDPIVVGDPNLWLPAAELESLLNHSLRGLNLSGLALRTRSKVAKEAVCRAIGYPVPGSFKRNKPRFPGQDLDVYSQKKMNFQVWNEELSPTRRYALLHLTRDDIVDRVKVVTGERLGELDTTGTLTQKYQARFVPRTTVAELLSAQDTSTIQLILSKSARPVNTRTRAGDYAEPGSLLSIKGLHQKLRPIVGRSFPDRGAVEDRNRGGDLHRLVCSLLGYSDFADDGSCPDVKNQLLEIKLQTSPTIDLGLICPNSSDPLDIPLIAGMQIAHSDLRYLVVGGATDGSMVVITRMYLVTGCDFFDFFPQFGGRVLNQKLQMHLPPNFFNP